MFFSADLRDFSFDVFPFEAIFVIVGWWIVVKVEVGLKGNFFSVDLIIFGLFLFSGGEDVVGGISKGIAEGNLHDLDFFGGIVFDHVAMGKDVFSFDSFFNVELSFSAKDNLNQFGTYPNIKNNSNKEEYIIAY